jgi:formylglycine-generating enzyme required for sulfatase activity
VPAGSFQRNRTPENITVISKGYWMGETEVTQELFQAVMGTNPTYLTSGAADGETQNQRPVEYVNWYAAIAFYNKLSITSGKDPVYSVSGIDWANLAYSSIPTYINTTWDAVGMDISKNGYRLPTETEWMWAAMSADTTSQPNTAGYSKDFAGSTGSNNIGNYAWYGGNSSKTHEVGKKTANELGGSRQLWATVSSCQLPDSLISRFFTSFFSLPLKTAGIFPYQDIPAFSFSPVFYAALRLYGKDRPVAGIYTMPTGINYMEAFYE